MGRRRKRATRTHVAIVQDKSGSMSDRTSATISGYNEYVQSLQREAEGDVLLTLAQFDSQVTNVFTAKPISDVKEIGTKDYVPYGTTALYDAVGRAIGATGKAIGTGDKVLVVIMTDGGENSSKEFTHEAILQLLGDKRKAGWEFIFLGAGEEAWDTGASLGFNQNTSINYGVLDAYDHKVGMGELIGSTNSVLRGSTAQAYLSTSPVKMRLEAKAKGEITPDDIATPPRWSDIKSRRSGQ